MVWALKWVTGNLPDDRAGTVVEGHRRIERRAPSQLADYASSAEFTAVRPAACLRRVHGRVCRASCGSSQLHPGFLCRRCLLVRRGGPRGRFRGWGGLSWLPWAAAGCSAPRRGDRDYGRYREQWETLRVTTRGPGELLLPGG